jgi:hypothetical protein
LSHTLGDHPQVLRALVSRIADEPGALATLMAWEYERNMACRSVEWYARRIRALKSELARRAKARARVRVREVV